MKQYDAPAKEFKSDLGSPDVCLPGIKDPDEDYVNKHVRLPRGYALVPNGWNELLGVKEWKIVPIAGFKMGFNPWFVRTVLIGLVAILTFFMTMAFYYQHFPWLMMMFILIVLVVLMMGMGVGMEEYGRYV